MQTVGGVLPSSTLQHTHTQTVGWFIQIIIIYKLQPRLKYRSQYESRGFSPLFHSLSLSLSHSLVGIVNVFWGSTLRPSTSLM